MKSLVPWICFFVTSASQQAIADEYFDAYRLGNYNKAATKLMSKTGQDALADYYLGRLYLYGYGQLKNNDLAIRYFTKAAEKGYLPAVQIMARYSLMQDKNIEQAVHWFKQAASAGDVSGQMFMAAAYLYGLGVKKNSDTATRFYISAAKNGNATAQFVLASHFIDDRHSANEKLGLIWLNKSANNNSRALTKLGRLYFDGKLVPQDKTKGIELLKKAALQNHTPALIELGEIALTQNEAKEAIEWFNQAINLHDNSAYLNLARVYLQQKSALYDAKAGFLATLKAAEEHVATAKSALANLYQKGIGVSADPNLAQQWLAQEAQEAQKKKQLSPLKQATLWLSDGETDKLEKTSYQMKGIFSAWNNTSVLRDNIYIQAPRMQAISRDELFDPQFKLIGPNQIPITNYYDALISKKVEFPANQWAYPSYHLNPHIETLEKINSTVMARDNLPIPYIEANYYDNEDSSTLSLIGVWTPGWQQQVNYTAVFNQMYSKAILGDSQSLQAMEGRRPRPVVPGSLRAGCFAAGKI